MLVTGGGASSHNHLEGSVVRIDHEVNQYRISWRKQWWQHPVHSCQGIEHHKFPSLGQLGNVGTHEPTMAGDGVLLEQQGIRSGKERERLECLPRLGMQIVSTTTPGVIFDVVVDRRKHALCKLEQPSPTFHRICPKPLFDPVIERSSEAEVEQKHE